MGVCIVLDLWFRFWKWLALGEAKGYELIVALVEVLVLIVIAYEGVYREWRVRRWIHHIYETCFHVGLDIRERVPKGDASAATVQRWNADVAAWWSQTQLELIKHSPQSAAAFVLQPVRVALQNSVAHMDCQNELRMLANSLENIKDIMEKPDIYF